MAKYRLSEKAAPFERDGSFSFKSGYTVSLSGGGTKIVGRHNAPLVTIPSGSTVSTTNPYTQQILENFRAPNSSRRGGVARANDHLFILDNTPGPADLDLDEVLV